MVSILVGPWIKRLLVADRCQVRIVIKDVRTAISLSGAQSSLVGTQLGILPRSVSPALLKLPPHLFHLRLLRQMFEYM